MQIALINNDSICYGSLLYFLNSIKYELKEMGHNAIIINEIDDDFMHKHWDAVVGINQEIFSEQFDDESFIFDYLNCPIILIIVDSPYLHHKSLSKHPENMHLVCLDIEHVQYAQEYYGPFKSVSMGCLSGPSYCTTDFNKRDINILFPCTHSDLDEITNKILAYKTKWIKDLFEYLIETGISTPNTSTTNAVLQYFKNQNISISKEDYKIAMAICGSYSEFYLRSYFRERVVNVLLEHNIDFTILGSGWKKIISHNYTDNIKLIENVNYADVSKYMATSKIVLNVMPWFKDGFHDRISTSMLNGAISLTDNSTYIESNFTNREDILIYNLDNINELPQIISDISIDSSLASKISRAGYAKASNLYKFKTFVTNNIISKIK